MSKLGLKGFESVNQHQETSESAEASQPMPDRQDPSFSGYPTDMIDQLARLRQTVEKDHASRLGRIENDLRWIITLVSAQLVAILGGAVATFTLN